MSVFFPCQVGYQNFLQLNYVDKFLSEIHLRFRDQYKNELKFAADGEYKKFAVCYEDTLRQVETEAREQKAKPQGDEVVPGLGQIQENGLFFD